MKTGIKETKELLGFLLGLSNALGESLEDGKVTLIDIASLATPLLDAPEALTGLTEIPSELSDLDDAEREEILAYAKEEFSIPETCVEEIVECAFDAAAQLTILVQKLIAACKKVS